MADRIELEAVEVDVVVGITEPEQRTLQPVRMDVVLQVDLEGAAGGDLARSVNYAVVREQLVFLAEHGRFRLIETLAFAAVRLLLAPPPPASPAGQVDVAQVRVRKPTVLPRAVPSVTIERPVDWCDLQTRMVPERTWLDTLVDTPQGGAWRVHVEPESTWKVPVGVAVLVVAGTVVADGRTLVAGARLARGEVSAVRATGTLPATLLVVGALAGPAAYA